MPKRQMNKNTFWFWLLLTLLVLGMLATLWFGKGRTRHGYGTVPYSPHSLTASIAVGCFSPASPILPYPSGNLSSLSFHAIIRRLKNILAVS